MKEIKLTTTINRPVKEVFDFTINPANTPKWVEGVAVERTNETPAKLGTIYRNQDRDGNWREFEITAYEPGVMFEMTKKDDNHHVRYTFKPLSDNKCELEYYVHADGGELRGAFNQETIQKLLQKLKSVLENRIDTFMIDEKPESVVYVETIEVKAGVSCDVYTFKDDTSKDLAIVTVSKGHKTPLQRILNGSVTTEGFVSGKGKLTVTSINGETTTYKFDDGDKGKPVNVHVGEIMQWHADNDSDLVFYEICTPPYEEGRFENLAEDLIPASK